MRSLKAEMLTYPLLKIRQRYGFMLECFQIDLIINNSIKGFHQLQ